MKKILLSLALAFLLSACSNEESGNIANFNPNPKVGAPATDFLFKDMYGKPFRLTENKGKVVLLYFWRMKCLDCLDSMDSLEALNRAYRDKGLLVVGVGEDNMHSSPIEDVADLFKKKEYSFLPLRDDQGFVSEAYAVLKAPEAFVIDKNGVIASIQKGKTDWMSPENVKFIESLL